MIDTAEVHEAAPGEAARPSPLSASDRVYAYAKDAILTRQFVPHELLTEGELAESVGVSRTPVREALLRLQADGLVRLLPKRGALVLPVTLAEMADVLETRRLVETFAVRKVVAGPTAELVARLHAHLAAMRRAMRGGDARAYIVADRDFHAEIVTATGNEILTSLYRSLREKQLRMGAVNLLEARSGVVDPAGQQRMRANIADHEAIVTAITARAIRAGEAAVAAHLDRAEQQLRHH